MAMDPLYELALCVKAAHRELDRRIADTMRPLGLTPQQADAIYVIGKAQPLSLKQLGELLIAEGGHPSRLVDRLVDAGLVQRVAAGDDRRRVVLTLTPEGQELEGRIQANRQAVFTFARSLMDGMDVEPSLEMFRRLLKHSEFDDLLERRRALEAGSPRSAAPAE